MPFKVFAETIKCKMISEGKIILLKLIINYFRLCANKWKVIKLQL